MAGLGKLGVGGWGSRRIVGHPGIWFGQWVVSFDETGNEVVPLQDPVRQLPSPRPVLTLAWHQLHLPDPLLSWFLVSNTSLQPSGLLPEGASAFVPCLIFPCPWCSLRADTSSQLSLLMNQPWTSALNSPLKQPSLTTHWPWPCLPLQAPLQHIPAWTQPFWVAQSPTKMWADISPPKKSRIYYKRDVCDP